MYYRFCKNRGVVTFCKVIRNVYLYNVLKMTHFLYGLLSKDLSTKYFRNVIYL